MNGGNTMQTRREVSRENCYVVEIAVETYLGRHEPSLK
jgi:hypothetical protein